MSGHDHAARGDGHAGRAHGVSAEADRGKLAIALGLIVAFMIVEVVVGAMVHSLALLSGAAHMVTDAGALGPPSSRSRHSSTAPPCWRLRC